MGRTLSNQTPESIQASGGVRLEYTGKNAGAIPFTGPSGTVYRGGSSPSNRFVIAKREDVHYLTKVIKRFKAAPLPGDTTSNEEEAEVIVDLDDNNDEMAVFVDGEAFAVEEDGEVEEATLQPEKPRRRRSQAQPQPAEETPPSEDAEDQEG